MLATPELMVESAQPDRLAAVVPTSLRKVPLYKQQPASAAVLAEAEFTASHLQRLPFITKHDIRRDFPANFLGPNQELDALLEEDLVELEHTAGTSEERTPLLLPRGWWAEQELRALGLNATTARLLESDPAARRVTLSSPVCSGDICFTGVPSRQERTIGNTLFVSLSRFPFLWGEADLERIAAETSEWQPRFLDVDPVYGAVFARYCEARGLRLPSLEFILCSYEFVSVCHRRALERVFGVPVFDLYGSTETGHLLIETEQGQFRPSLETAFLEVIEPDAGGVGELVVTTLTNPFMPLVRYRIGDLVQKLQLPYATRYILHGRARDSFRTASGRRITTRQIDQCFTHTPGILHYQLVQKGPAEFVLRYAPDGAGPGSDELAGLGAQLEALLELSGAVRCEKSELLMPESSGKFRLGYPSGA
jgi:phenylacetate-CoA ligase